MVLEVDFFDNVCYNCSNTLRGRAVSGGLVEQSRRWG